MYLNNISEIIDNYYYESIDIINDFTEEVAIEDYESYDIIQNVINKYLIERQSVYKIYIGFSNGKSYFADRQYTADIYDPRVWPWFKNTKDSTTEIVFTKPYIGSDKFEHNPVNWDATIAKRIYKDNELYGVLAADINLKQIHNYINTIPLNDTSRIIILSEENKLIMTNKESITANLISYPAYNEILSKDDNDAIIDGITYEKAIKINKITGMKIIYLVTDVIVFPEVFNEIIEFILIMLISIIVLLYLSNKAKYIIMDPINNMQKQISNIGNGIALKHFEYPKNCPVEIENVVSTMNNMLDRITTQSTTLFIRNKEIAEQLNLIKSLYNDTDELNNKLRTSNTSLKKNYKQTIEALSSAIEEKDMFTQGHSKRVSEYCVKIAKEMDLSSDEIERLEIAALLHDIGKLTIDNTIINKPEKLDKEEFMNILNHPTTGRKILTGISFFKDIPEIIEQHHERPDGNGYPYGLKSDEINSLALIVSVADAYDVMTSTRSYKEKPFTQEEALREIENHKGTQFDTATADALIEVIRIDKLQIRLD